MQKLKIAWLCHFSNDDVRNILPLSKRRLYNFLRLLSGRQHSEYYDFAPWVTNLIREFEKLDDIELHIIAPFHGLKTLTYEFELSNIYYHFFQPDIPLLHIPYDRLNVKYIPQFYINRLYIRRFLKKIRPDLVNLIGSENPYYSTGALDIKDMPVYVSAQTVYTNPARLKYSDSVVKINWDTELKIHKKEVYFGCGGRMHRDLILKNNPAAIIFKMFFPVEKPKKITNVPKVFDFVFFAGIAKKKGVEDAIDALAIVKKTKSNVTLNIVGNCPAAYKNALVNKVKDLNLAENVSFNDYFPDHTDMHQHVVQGHFALLPVKLDVIPGSVIEAIYLGLPVVTYKTTGTPYLNRDGKSVLLSEIDDIEGLAENMTALLNSDALAEKLRENALAFVNREFDNAVSARRLFDNYKSVIDHYRHNIPIPSEQLFSIDEFPIY